MASINMKKQFLKAPLSKSAILYYILLILNTLLYTLIFGKTYIVFQGYNQKEVMVITICIFLFNLFLFLIIMLSRWIFIIINPVLYYFGAVAFIYAEKFYLDTNILTAPKFLLHNIISSPIFDNFTYILFIALMCIIGLLFGFIRFYLARDEFVVRIGQIFAIIFIISSFSYTFLYNNYQNIKIQPYVFWGSIKDYAVSNIMFKFQSKNRKDAIQVVKNDDNITGIVFLIDKLSGKYFQEHISNILPIVNMENIVLFNNIKSEFKSSMETRSAVITGSSAENLANYKNNTSFLSVIKNAGYSTSYIGIYNSLIAKDNHNYYIITNDTDNIHEIETKYSPNLFNSTVNIADFLHKNQGGLILINAEGVSPLIDMRYKYFTSYNSDKKYENYISYIITYINELIHILKDRMAFIIIHGLEGEYYDNVSSFHKESVMLVWVSDDLESKYGTRSRILSHNNDKILDNTLYNTVLGCLELFGNGVDENRNLCRK